MDKEVAWADAAALDSAEIHHSISLSDAIVGMSQKQSTKEQYAGAQKRFISWLLRQKD